MSLMSLGGQFPCVFARKGAEFDEFGGVRLVSLGVGLEQELEDGFEGALK